MICGKSSFEIEFLLQDYSKPKLNNKWIIVSKYTNNYPLGKERKDYFFTTTLSNRLSFFNIA